MPFLRSIAQGPLWREMEKSSRTSLSIETTLPPLSPAFLPKGQMGRHFRAVSRNGQVLLMSPQPLGEMEHRRVRLRVSIWHRAHLPREAPGPWGLLLFARALEVSAGPGVQFPVLAAALGGAHACEAALSVELGGGRFLNFLPEGPLSGSGLSLPREEPAHGSRAATKRETP